MTVTVEPASCQASGAGRVVVDPNFLQSGYYRKLYVALTPEARVLSEAHSHPSPHCIMLIDGGDARLAVQHADGRVEVIRLEPARYYHVPPNLPHQLDARGRAIIETYSPRASLVSASLAKRVLDTDLFELAAAQAREQEGGASEGR